MSLRSSQAKFPPVGKPPQVSLGGVGNSATLFLAHGTATLTVPAGTGYTKVSSFTESKSDGIVADLSNKRIRLDDPGWYDLAFSASTAMDASNVELQTAIFVSGVEKGDLRVERKRRSL